MRKLLWSFSDAGMKLVYLIFCDDMVLNGKKKTSSPKGNDRSPECESNVPRSNVVFLAIKTNHSKENSPETLFSPL